MILLQMAVLGSRDQMCIHPEVSKETNNNTKVHMCQMRVKAKTCYFNNQVEWYTHYKVCDGIVYTVYCTGALMQLYEDG